MGCAHSWSLSAIRREAAGGRSWHNRQSPGSNKMGKGKGATVSVQNLGWEDLAEAAEKAGKPSVVVDLIRDNELDAATALLLEEADIDEVAPKRLDRLK